MRNKFFTFLIIATLLCTALVGAAPKETAAATNSSATTTAAVDTTTNGTAATTDTAAIDSTPYGLPKELLPLWDSLTIKQKAAQMIMVYFSAPKTLIENEFGAVLVMKPHLKNVSSFKSKLQAANKGLRIPLLVATDQEGGRVNRISGISKKWKNAPSAKQMRNMSNDSIEQIAQSIGMELSDLGINLNLAPVLDPAKDDTGKNSFIEDSDRSWDKDESSTEKVRSFVSGMKQSGVFCVSKHFPGYDSWSNSDHQIAISNASPERISRNVGLFSALVDDIPLTMVSSVRFTKISDRPAVFEPKIIQMARNMSEETVILTDDLWGVSLRTWISGTEEVSNDYPKEDFIRLVVTALDAGNDMFMITFPARAIEMIDYLVQLSKNDPKYKTRIEESAARILKMKYKAGLLQ